MKTIVVYKSETGFTKKYASWISEELKADIYESNEVNVDMLLRYNTVIYGGGLYAAGIKGVSLITSNLERLKGKKIVVFATGASPVRTDVVEHVINSNFTEEQLKQLKFFYLRGGFNYKGLTPISKVLMIILKYKIKLKLRLKGKLTSDERGMLHSYEKPMDFTNRKNLDELLEYIKYN